MSSSFKFLDSILRDVIAEIGEVVEFGTDDPIFRRGSDGEAFYLVEIGSVRVHDGDLVLNTLGEGEVFGEIAALGNMMRTASVTAVQDTRLLRVEREPFLLALESRPDAFRVLVEMLCERESGMANRMTDRAWQLHLAEREMEIGRSIQAGFLPDAMPDVAGYEIAGHFQAARVVAGDFYDAFFVPSINRVALVIGDVCDKGVGAALFMTLFRSLIRAALQSNSFTSWATHHDPASATLPDDADCETISVETLVNAVSLTNNYVATTHGKTSMFASAFIGLLDPETGRLSYVNAGHEEAFVVGSNGIRCSLPPTGPVLGVFPGVQPAVATATLEDEELFLAYSDGVPEAVNAAGEQFSETRLKSLLDSWEGGAGNLADAIATSVNTYTQGAAQHDDITILTVKRMATNRETG